MRRSASPAPALTAFAPDHARGVVDLIRGVYAEYGMIFDDGFESDLGDVDAAYGRSGGAFWVLLAGERVVGTVGVRPADVRTAELKRLYLHPEYRGRGHGRVLLEHALGWARARGHTEAVAWSDVRFGTAHAVYRRMGFEAFGDRVLDDPDRSHEIGFRLPLGGRG